MADIKFQVIKKIVETQFKYKDIGKISEIDTISPPSVFIGSKLKYPLMNVGILSPLDKDDNAWVYDDAKYWADNNFGIGDVVKLRENLLNSRFKRKATDVRTSNKFLDIAKDIAVAHKPVDVEIHLKKVVNVDRKQDKVVLGHGLNALLKKARIVSNIKIHRKIDRVINDDIKATEGISYLYKNNFDEYTLSKILSVGALGMKKNKILVPTRWSITATDDTIGKFILDKVRNYPWIENYELFLGEFLGNQYLILLFPNIWNYELFEIYSPGSSWNLSSEIKASTDLEWFEGRKDYATATAGGYYATRLKILEYLESIKKQASVLVIRIETPSYWAGLGVWVVRESVKKAFENRVIKFYSKEELIESAKQISKIKYNFDNSEILKKSRLLEKIKTQKSLNEWF